MKDLNRIVESLGSSGLLSGLAGGLAGGALTGALTSKKGRKLGKTALKVGALAAVSGLAWKAYQNYQRTSAAGAGAGGAEALTEGRFAAVAADANGNPGPLLLLRAMITAAHADGHIDADERQRIFDRVAELHLDSSDKALLFDELREPLSVDALVAEVPDQETAIEVYVSSALAVDPRQPSSQSYLRRLATRLGLPRGIVEAVHQEARLPGPQNATQVQRSTQPGADFHTAA
ncbi:MAG: tellurite resistance TerB family protein [Pseudomonadales bacterium]